MRQSMRAAAPDFTLVRGFPATKLPHLKLIDSAANPLT
jgi:hypothetical protein